MDIGVWCQMPEPHPGENWLEKQEIKKGKLICIGLKGMPQFQEKYPGTLCVQADGRSLPFKNGTVDIAVANAVLEHVPLNGQESFAFEISRVIKCRAVLAVPDRWCPLEIHSRISIAQWLSWWRRIINNFSEKFWASPMALASIFT